MRYRIDIYRRGPRGEEGWLSIESLDCHPELLERLAALGIVDVEDGWIHQAQVRRLEKLLRLRSHLGVNLAGAAVILDLLERIEELEAQLRK
jgi:MerR family transcriptional regulator, heat shock protein HspR